MENIISTNVAFDKMFGKLDYLVKLPLEQQMYRCDWITKGFVDSGNNEPLETIFKSNHNFEVWNQSSIGNIAYIAVMCNNAAFQTQAKKLLQDYAEWYEKIHT